jgi:hypothetical protein
LPEDFGEYDEKIGIDFQPKFIQKIVKIGEVRSLEMNLYEVNHRSENDPRISLSRDSFRLLAHYGVKRALILFISENSLNYRLSLVTIDLKWEEGKRVKKEYSNPRRYSFFLGPETKTHTPETYLIKKGRVKDFDDLKERFSLEIVNKDFYTQIAILFTKLAGGERTIGRTQFDEKGSLYLPSTTDDKIKKEFSVRLIGRLVFCWFLKKKCSDKGTSLLPEELLSSKAVIRKSDFYHNILEPLFFEILNTPIKERIKEYQLPPWAQIPFLNGGLFANEYNDYYEIDQLGISKYINTLKVPDSWLKELFEIFEIYNFTIDENTSVDVELSIEPEMLGRIFENLLAEINPETGNTARKATGSYYTPRPIVEYMVNESLKQYLLTKTNLDEKKISSLLAYEEEEVDLSESEKDTVLDALDVIKIIDPACGSGAFPMGILQKMLLILQKIDSESKKWLLKKLSKIDNNIVKKEITTKLQNANWNYVHKLGIIQSSIYGVDILPIAVDISKLRFFLSLIVDENVDDSKENRGIDSLPNLEFKFVCANSLIGLPKKNSQTELFEVADKIRELKKLREEYLRCYGDEKTLIERKFQDIQNKMFLSSLKWLNWGGGDSQSVKLSQWNPFSGESCAWFDPDWMFGIEDGFDIVIENPPYIRQEDIKEQKPILQKAGYEVYNSTSDIYTYFYEKSYKLLKDKGISCFISSNKWMRAKYGHNLRKFFKEKTTLKQIIDFNGYKVFEATVDTNILIFQKTKPVDINIMSIINIKPDFTKNTDIVKYLQIHNLKIKQSTLDINCFVFAEEAILNLKARIEKFGTPLKNWDVRICFGIKTGFNKAFIIDTVTKEKLCKENPKSAEIIKPILRGRDISRYYYKWAGLWIIKIESGWTNRNRGKEEPEYFFKKYYPSVYHHLISYKDVKGKGKGLFNRDDQGGYWWELRDCAYYSEFEKEKILYQEMSYESSFSWDNNKMFVNQTCYIISNANKYVLSLLNSKLINDYFRLISQTLGTGAYRWIKQYVEQIPIPKISSTEQKPFIELVDRILAITKDKDYLENPERQAQVKEYEKQIDQMVYKLYGLTDEEIKIVENFHKKV